MPIVFSGSHRGAYQYRVVVRDERNIYYLQATETGSFWDSRHFRIGSALCSYSDEFDLYHGLNLARMRAMAGPVFNVDTALALFRILSRD